MSSSQEILLRELPNTVLEKEPTKQLFQKMHKEGGNFEQILQIIHAQLLPSLKKEIETLSSLKEQQLEILFFSCKNKIHEAIEWLKIAHGVFTEKSNTLSATEQTHYQSTLTLLKEWEDKINGHTNSILSYRSTKLQTDFTASIDSILREMQSLLFSHMEMKKRIELLHYVISKKVFKKIKDRLSQAKEFLSKNRPKWEKEVVSSGRTLYIYVPSEFAYPIIYTKEGKIYIIQEVVEHFVGSGLSKYVSRTFEMQEGKIRALIRPKKDFPDDMPEFDKNFLKNYNLKHSLKEIKFLKALKGKRGLIEQYETCVFEMSNDTELFQICELFDSEDLARIIQTIHTDPKKIHLSPKELTAITRDMLYGLVALHQARIIHHDIKTNNILVHIENQEREAKARIIDLNVACFDDDPESKQEISNPMYASPELCKVMYDNEGKYGPHFIPVTTFALDVWGMGCSLYQLFFDPHFPWDKDYKNALKFPSGIIIEQTLEVAMLQDNWIPREYHSHPFYPLLNAMLQVDPSNRITAQEALSLFEELTPRFLQDHL